MNIFSTVKGMVVLLFVVVSLQAASRPAINPEFERQVRDYIKAGIAPQTAHNLAQKITQLMSVNKKMSRADAERAAREALALPAAAPARDSEPATSRPSAPTVEQLMRDCRLSRAEAERVMLDSAISSAATAGSGTRRPASVAAPARASAPAASRPPAGTPRASDSDVPTVAEFMRKYPGMTRAQAVQLNEESLVQAAAEALRLPVATSALLPAAAAGAGVAAPVAAAPVVARKNLTVRYIVAESGDITREDEGFAELIAEQLGFNFLPQVVEQSASNQFDRANESATSGRSHGLYCGHYAALNALLLVSGDVSFNDRAYNKRVIQACEEFMSDVRLDAYNKRRAERRATDGGLAAVLKTNDLDETEIRQLITALSNPDLRIAQAAVGDRLIEQTVVLGEIGELRPGVIGRLAGSLRPFERVIIDDFNRNPVGQITVVYNTLAGSSQSNYARSATGETNSEHWVACRITKKLSAGQPAYDAIFVNSVPSTIGSGLIAQWITYFVSLPLMSEIERDAALIPDGGHAAAAAGSGAGAAPRQAGVARQAQAAPYADADYPGFQAAIDASFALSQNVQSAAALPTAPQPIAAAAASVPARSAFLESLAAASADLDEQIAASTQRASTVAAAPAATHVATPSRLYPAMPVAATFPDRFVFESLVPAAATAPALPARTAVAAAHVVTAAASSHTAVAAVAPDGFDRMSTRAAALVRFLNNDEQVVAEYRRLCVVPGSLREVVAQLVEPLLADNNARLNQFDERDKSRIVAKLRLPFATIALGAQPTYAQALIRLSNVVELLSIARQIEALNVTDAGHREQVQGVLRVALEQRARIVTLLVPGR